MVVHVPNYPKGIARAVRELPPVPWIYTGGLENRPRLVHAISLSHPLRGNSADVLRGIRDPFCWTAILDRAGLPTLTVRRFDNPPCPDAKWLRKPIRSAGGLRIEPWRHVRPPSRKFFFQQRASGDSYSATFLAIPQSNGREVRLVGIVRHFTDHRGLHTNRFGWCGGMTLTKFSSSASETLIRMASVMADRCGLIGIFGIDFLWNRETVWPVEINPRYTATGELWDVVRKRSLIADHIATCEGHSPWEHEASTTTVAAKVVVYAPMTLRVLRPFTDAAIKQTAPLEPFQLPSFADIPQADTTIPAGWPVCTVLANAESESATLNLLEQRLEWLSEQFQQSGQQVAWRCQF